IVALPAAWLIFALQYTERGSRLTRRTLTLLAIEPALALILLWTTNFHGLFFKSFGLDTTGPVPQWDGVNGVGYWINIIYSYILIFTGTLILLQALVRPQGSRLYRGRAIAVLAGVLSPWVANVLYAFYGLPLPGLDPTPFALAVTGLAFAWGIFRLRLFDIVPVVHEALPENLREWREQVLDNILNGVLVFGLLALAGGINNVIQAYRQVASLYDRPLVLAIAIITAYVTATLAVFIAAFWRGPGYTWRAGTLLSVFYGLGALGLALSGLSGDGRLFLFAFVILTAILFGLRRGLGALALSVLTFATTAWLLVNGVIQIPGLRQANSTDPSAWLSGGLVFVLLAVGAVTSVTYLMQRLEHGLIQTQSELAERQRAEAALRASEARLQRLNGVLRAISAINQLIVRERDRERLLAEACQIFIRERDYAFVWIGLLGADGVTVHLAAASGPADPAHFHFRLDEPGH
ncbi:MAG: histidine kinase N-terminal 7TM domain-containing protein, partial [Chloroflexota bacterium]